MRRRAFLAVIVLAGAIPALRGWAEERRREWRAPRVARGWVLADDDR